MKCCEYFAFSLWAPRCADCATYAIKLCDNCHKGLWQMSQRFATNAKTSVQLSFMANASKWLQHFIVGEASSLCPSSKMIVGERHVRFIALAKQISQKRLFIRDKGTICPICFVICPISKNWFISIPINLQAIENLNRKKECDCVHRERQKCAPREKNQLT